MEIDNNPNSPYKGRVYMSVTQIDASESNDVISVSRSSDGGQTFKTVAVDGVQHITSFVDQFSDLAVGADGTVYVTWMRCQYNSQTGLCAGQPATMYFSKSTNGGRTWTPEVAMATVTLAPGTGGFYGSLPHFGPRVSNIPTVAVDTSSGANAGNLYSIQYDWTGSYLRVQVITSTDDGATWSKPVFPAPSTDTHDQFHPWINVSATGKIGATWMDRRNDPNDIQFEAFEALSKDGGLSFGTNKKLATKPSTPSGFIGDYTGNAWAGNILYASWTDERTGVGQDAVGWIG